VEVEREARDFAARLQPPHDHFGPRGRPEQPLMKLLLGRGDLVQQALEFGQLTNQLQDHRHVRRRGRLNVKGGHGVLSATSKASMVPCIIK
jgi:hypothetical protein